MVWSNQTTDEAQLQNCLAKAALPDNDFLEKEAGEKGVQISGGQRQRVALARAFVKDAPIIIMDEPTASLDIQSEGIVLNSIRQLKKDGKTVILISHRESTVSICDRVLYVRDHHVYDDLDKTSPTYN